jgi:hypothetical protein
MPRAAAMPFAQGVGTTSIGGPRGAGGFNPFDDSKRDVTQDEVIELLEPPPSTWFDDLDSAPMPLEPLRSAAPAQTRAR